MAASLVVVGFLVVCFGGFTTQFPQQGPASDVTTTSYDVTSASNVANSTAMPCATVRGLPGSCVDRQYCDYSTYAIDLTLYAPKSYKKPCAENETCCPFNYQITVESKSVWEDKQLSFDDNE